MSVSGGTVNPVKTARYTPKKGELDKFMLNFIFGTLGTLAARRSTQPCGLSDSLSSAGWYVSNYLDKEKLLFRFGFLLLYLWQLLETTFQHLRQQSCPLGCYLSGSVPISMQSCWKMLVAVLYPIFLRDNADLDFPSCVTVLQAKCRTIFAKLVLTFCILDSVKLHFPCSFGRVFFLILPFP